MSDETKMVEATVGPFAGQRLTMPADVADQAIKDGWARDPFAPPPTEEELAKRKEPTEDDRLKSTAAAEKAVRKLRGENSDPPPSMPAPAPSEAPGTIADAGTSTTKAKR